MLEQATFIQKVKKRYTLHLTFRQVVIIFSFYNLMGLAIIGV